MCIWVSPPLLLSPFVCMRVLIWVDCRRISAPVGCREVPSLPLCGGDFPPRCAEPNLPCTAGTRRVWFVDESSARAVGWLTGARAGGGRRGRASCPLGKGANLLSLTNHHLISLPPSFPPSINPSIHLARCTVGVCGGDGSSCIGCDGVINSGASVDACGECNGTNACLGCDGVAMSGAAVDVCGVCAGDNSSCTGCDGVARPGGGLEEDSCGNCGGTDSSCRRPPRVGLEPVPVDFICPGPASGVALPRVQGEVWWAAPSNKSSADFIAICPSSAPPVYAPHTCVLLSDALPSTPSGRASLDMLLAPGSWQLRYYQKSPEPATLPARTLAPFRLAHVSAFQVLEASAPRCGTLAISVATDGAGYCLGQPVVVSWQLPAAEVGGTDDIARIEG